MFTPFCVLLSLQRDGANIYAATKTTRTLTRYTHNTESDVWNLQNYVQVWLLRQIIVVIQKFRKQRSSRLLNTCYHRCKLRWSQNLRGESFAVARGPCPAGSWPLLMAKKRSGLVRQCGARPQHSLGVAQSDRGAFCAVAMGASIFRACALYT